MKSLDTDIIKKVFHYHLYHKIILYRLYKWGLANHLLHKFYASFDYLFETKNGQNDTRFITFCHYDKLLIQPETPETIFSYFKAFLNFLWKSPFILFTIITSVIIPLVGNHLLIELYANPFSHFVTILTLVELGYFSVDRTLTNYLRSNPPELQHRSTTVIIPSFIIMCLITNIVYFGIFTWSPFIPEFSNTEQQEQLKSLLKGARISSLGAIGSYIIFFYGNRIWLNIRKRDLQYSI